MTDPSYEAISAHYGWRDWLSQRVTAVVMAIYTLRVLGIVVWHGGVWKGLFANNAFKLATFLFMIALFFHAWVGVRNIAMDYVKPTAWRLAAQMIAIAMLIAYAGWTMQILWGAV